jgi:hypothetical protein
VKAVRWSAEAAPGDCFPVRARAGHMTSARSIGPGRGHHSSNQSSSAGGGGGNSLREGMASGTRLSPNGIGRYDLSNGSCWSSRPKGASRTEWGREHPKRQGVESFAATYLVLADIGQ